MASRNATFYDAGFSGALFTPVKKLFFALLLILALLLSTWIVEGLFVFYIWPDGYEHLNAMLRNDLVEASVIGGYKDQLGRFAGSIANLMYGAVFKFTGIHDMATRFAEGASLSVPDTVVRNLYLNHYNAIQVIMTSTQLFGVRLAELIAVVPLIFLAYVIAMADGLVLRAIRAARAGNESANIYHRAKYFQIVLISMLGAFYVLIPVSVDPRYLLFPGIGFIAFLARCQWTYYKKYL